MSKLQLKAEDEEGIALNHMGEVNDIAEDDDCAEEPPNTNGNDGDGFRDNDRDRRYSTMSHMTIGTTHGPRQNRITHNAAGGVGLHFHPLGVLELDGTKDPDDVDEQDGQHASITLPQSTHTLLFTTNVFTFPFGFAFIIFGISIAVLVLAMLDNLDGSSKGNILKVPANISKEVRAAQYLSIIVAVLIEEEVPTALYLLKMLPRETVEQLGLSYPKFVMSVGFRLAIGEKQ